MPTILELASQMSGESAVELERVAEKYPVLVSEFITQRIEQGSYPVAAVRQFLPDIRELAEVDGYVADPTGEGELHPEPALLQTYANRLVIIVTQRCLVYCRFCCRKEFVGFSENSVSGEVLSSALQFLRGHSEIEDVLISGGDPLALPNSQLIPLLDEIASIPHVKAIRLNSRALSVQPSRIDDELLTFLGSRDTFWYYAHMNHPADVNHPDVIECARRLLSVRVPVLNQCVILGGVNDDPSVILDLMRSCYYNKIIPYNLYVLDRVRGIAHFEVPIERIVKIAEALSELPGPAQPVLVFVDQHSRKHRAVFSESIDIAAFFRQRP